MRIAMFSNTFVPLVGGTERSVATFSEDLARLGHEVLVVTTGETKEAGGDPTVLRVPTGKGGRAIDEALDKFAPDVIHAHQPFLLGGQAFHQARRRGCPMVLTHHTLYGRPGDREALAQFRKLEAATCDLAVTFSNHCDAVIAPTASVAELLRKQGVNTAITVVPTGIDSARFACGDGGRFRGKVGIPEGAFVVGHLGRLIPAKRVGYLAEAVAIFLRDEPSAFALFCGEGESVAEILANFASAGVEDRFVLVGNLPENEVADAFAAMDLFTFASLTDTQGIVLLEAMAAGVPVLAHRATGPQDLVIGDSCGRLLDPGASPEEFADAIANFARLRHLGAHAEAMRSHAAAFDRRQCAVRLEDVYRDALLHFRLREKRQASPLLLDRLQRRVETEWRLLSGRAEGLRALLPTRGFPVAEG